MNRVYGFLTRSFRASTHRDWVILSLLLAVVVGWVADRSQLTKKHEHKLMLLQSRIANTEKYEDPREHELMNRCKVGDAITDHPDLRYLADYSLKSDHEHFQTAFEFFGFGMKVTDNDIEIAGKDCEILAFEMPDYQGTPFNFGVLICDGIIARWCSYEPLYG